MITVSEIRRLCFENAYRKGRTYYQNGYVKSTQIEQTDDDPDVLEVSGFVRGSGRKVYDVALVVSTEDEILDYTCDCPAYESYWGMCKHCVALALGYQEEQKRHRYDHVFEQQQIVRGTSDALKKMLYRYSVKNRMNRMGGLDGEVRLEFFFQSDRSGLLLECRIGSKRMYVVKNLVKLVRDVQEMRQVRYGANLDFVHDLTAFTAESRSLFALLEGAVVSRYPDYQDSYYEMSGNFRYLLLRHEMLEQFLTHFLGNTLRLDEQDIPVLDENPPLKLTLKETLGGAELEADPMEVYAGSHRTFVKKNKKFYRCSPEFAEQVLPVWQTIRRGQGERYRRKPLFLSREDYGSFCGNILPALQPFVEVESGALNLADYAPAEPEFSIYLGMPEELLVEAAARVRYDEEEYDLLEAVSAGGVCRNPEREQEVRALMQKYFHLPEPAPQRKVSRKRQALDEWLDDVPSRDLDADVMEIRGGAGRQILARELDEYGLPVRNLDADIEETVLPSSGIHMVAEGEDALYQLLEHGLSELGSRAELFVDDSIRGLRIQPSPKVTMGIGFAGDLLDLDVQVEGMDMEEITGILAGYRRRKKYYRLKSGDFIRLEDSSLGALSELSEGLNLSEKDLKSGHVELEKYRALYLENVLRDSENTRVRRMPDYRRLIRNMRDFTDSDFEVPENLCAELRRYQREGFRWLCTLYEYGFGGILADDMGLGKTLQIITLLLSVAERRPDAFSLIVAPASLVYNWESEVQHFAPDLTVQVIAGTAAERQEQIAHAAAFQVNITSYDLLKRDVDSYEGLVFDCCVVDEAQYIKNAATQAAHAVKKMRAAHRFALTGTPIENRLSDLWSIFDFLMPGYLFSYSKFREELESAIVRSADEVAVKRLQRMVTPFLLRRKKGDVLKDLPDKLEEAVYIRMTDEQDRVYRASVERLRQDLMRKDEQEIRESRLQILAELTRLRQLCCSPELCFDNYKGGSGKVDTCLELLKSATEGGHRVLVFSQFTQMLELLQREWKKTGQDFRYLSGKDSKLARRTMVEDFQRGEIPVFFISLKAGGTGLNLTAADMVIHCDPWWNVAAQNQATDRAHRIGQRRVVNVMKLVAKETIEEKILKLQDKKAALADSVVEGEGVKDFTLNKEELMELFQ